MIGRPHKLDWSLINKFLEEGKTPVEVAKELNVTVPAVRYVMKQKIKKNAIVSTVTFEKGREILTRNLDTMTQLQEANQHTRDIRDLVVKAIKGDKNAITLLNIDSRFKRKDPLEIFIKANAQITEQLTFQAQIFKTLYTIQQINEYQEEVESVMEEMEPGMRAKFLKRLKEKQLMHSAIQWKDGK